MYDFRYENSIGFETKKLELSSCTAEEPYNKWRTNTVFSNHVDTVFYANMMNLNPGLTDQMHYDFMFGSIRKMKRFNKKKTEFDKKQEALAKAEQEKIELIQEFYKYSVEKAKTAAKILNDEQLDELKKMLSTGGVI